MTSQCSHFIVIYAGVEPNRSTCNVPESLSAVRNRHSCCSLRACWNSLSRKKIISDRSSAVSSEASLEPCSVCTSAIREFGLADQPAESVSGFARRVGFLSRFCRLCANFSNFRMDQNGYLPLITSPQQKLFSKKTRDVSAEVAMEHLKTEKKLTLFRCHVGFRFFCEIARALCMKYYSRLKMVTCWWNAFYRFKQRNNGICLE